MLCYYTLKRFQIENLIQLLPIGSQLNRNRLAPEPDGNECQPTSDGDGNTSHPWPSSANLPGAWELVVRKVAHCDGVLLLNVREEGALVVDLEVEDTVLVWEDEGCAVGCRVGR